MKASGLGLLDQSEESRGGKLLVRGVVADLNHAATTSLISSRFRDWERNLHFLSTFARQCVERFLHVYR